MSGLNTSGGVHRSVTCFGGAEVERDRGAGGFLGLGGALTGFAGTGGGWPWMHWDLGRSHSSQ
jgi:hypothetical protein